MTLENLLSQMGIGTKQLTDRYSGEYGAPVQDQHIYYAYEPSQPTSHGHTASSKHHHGGGGGLKSNASMSALTLLAFLFFLHILQQCIKEHMTEMNAAPVVVMSASRETNDELTKSATKLDKSGVTETDNKKENFESNPYESKVNTDDKMMRINAAQHKPKRSGNVANVNYNGDNSSPGFIGAMSNE